MSPKTETRRLPLLGSAALPIWSLHDAAPVQAAPVSFSGTVVNQTSGMCMGVPNGSASNGVQLITRSCRGESNQNFISRKGR